MAAHIYTDEEIQQNVLDELAWDPEIEATDVGVEVDDGVVTLTGTVETFAQKWAAERAALRVEGVRAVANNVQVRPAGLGIKSDTDIARAVANALEWNTAVPFDKIDIRVEDGRVTLEGEVEWNYQREAAENTTRQISGVKSVLNLITVRQPQVKPDDVRDSIERALVRHAELDANRIKVSVEGGHITLSGTVRSWAEKKAAEDAAWRSPGVTAVTNNIRIDPSLV